MRDFTLKKFALLIKLIGVKGLHVYGVKDWVLEEPSSGVLMRHDVDRKPLNALNMARLENSLGIQSTYYFRVVGSAYNPDIIREISNLGHEIGYHYEDLSTANGNLEEAHRLFTKHLNVLRKIAHVETVAMHGSPLSRHNNLDIWKTGSLADYGLIADAFISVNYSSLPYFTDTGRSWGADAANLRDKPQSVNGKQDLVKTSDDLINFMNDSKYERLAISAHPERWANNLIDWSSQVFKDYGINGVKRVLSVLR